MDGSSFAHPILRCSEMNKHAKLRILMRRPGPDGGQEHPVGVHPRHSQLAPLPVHREPVFHGRLRRVGKQGAPLTRHLVGLSDCTITTGCVHLSIDKQVFPEGAPINGVLRSAFRSPLAAAPQAGCAVAQSLAASKSCWVALALQADFASESSCLSCPTNPHPQTLSLQAHADICDNLVPVEIALRVSRAIIEGDPFAAYIIIPMWPEGAITFHPNAHINMRLWVSTTGPAPCTLSSRCAPGTQDPSELMSGLPCCRHPDGRQRAGGAALADGHDPHDVPHRGQGHPAQGAAPSYSRISEQMSDRLCRETRKISWPTCVVHLPDTFCLGDRTCGTPIKQSTG